MQQKINSFSFSFITFILMNVFFLFSMPYFYNLSNTTDILISCAIGFLIGYLFLQLFFFFFYQPDNIFVYLKKNFSTIVSYLFLFLLLFLCFLITRYLLFSICLFLEENMSMDLSLFAIYLLLLISSFFLVKEGKNTILITGIIFFFLSIFFIILSTGFSFFSINQELIYPITFSQISPKLSLYTFLFCFVPILFLLAIPKNTIRNETSYQKQQKKIYLFTSIFLLFKILLFIAILGIPYLKILKYPEIHILKQISLFHFIERIEESFLLWHFLIAYFTITFLIYYIKEGMLTFFHIKKEKNLLLGIYLIFLFSYLFISEQSILSPLLFLSLFLLLHLLIFILIQIKKTFKKS